MANFEHVNTGWVRKAFYIECLWWVLLKLIHFLSLRHATLLKETPTKVCSCENCEVLRTSIYPKNPLTTASSVPASYC